MGNNLVETLIGAVVVAVAGVFLVFAYSTAGMRSAGGGYEISAKFDKVDGLNVGADVRMSGIKVGTVTAQSLDPQTYQAVVRFTVASTYQLPADSTARIASEGLLGGNYLALEPGGAADMIKAGGQIQYTQGAVSLLDLLGKAIYSLGAPAAGDSAAPPAN
jgi:phospholipid/cholesterol/gamma-HCH transport system substrate-binding protein